MSRRDLEQASKWACLVCGDLSLVLEHGRGLTRGQLVAWVRRLRAAADTLEKLLEGRR